MALTVLDPTADESAEPLQPAPLLDSVTVLKGATVGFISNGKEGTDGFFKHMETLLKETFEVGEVVSLCKSNYSAPAEVEIVDAAKEWTLAITGLGD